jgi:hypothetical protein
MFVPGVDSRDATPSQVLTLLSRSADRFKGSRVNVGAFNPSDESQDVTFRVYAETGALLGRVTRRLKAHQALQVNDIFGALGITVDVPAAYCLVQGDGVHPVLAYAAVIDNQSQDPFFVVGQDDPESPLIEN